MTLLPTPVADNSRGLPSKGTDFQSLPNAVCALLPTPRAADCRGATTRSALTDQRLADGRANLPEFSVSADWGDYGPAIRRWEAIHGPAPTPTEPGKNGPRLNPAFVEWMMGLAAGWVTDVPGLSRNHQLKLLGNGVLPLQAACAVRWLLSVIGMTEDWLAKVAA